MFGCSAEKVEYEGRSASVARGLSRIPSRPTVRRPVDRPPPMSLDSSLPSELRESIVPDGRNLSRGDYPALFDVMTPPWRNKLPPMPRPDSLTDEQFEIVLAADRATGKFIQALSTRVLELEAENASLRRQVFLTRQTARR